MMPVSARNIDFVGHCDLGILPVAVVATLIFAHGSGSAGYAILTKRGAKPSPVLEPRPG
jgi:hypothetical protein